MASIADLRQEYSAEMLLEGDVAPSPIDQFRKWWEQVLQCNITEPNAMTLATASPDGTPAARIVLLKDYSDGGFVFFTNYSSFKGMQLEENPKACLVFFWKELERQVRITGLVKKLPAADSDAYFVSRPRGSQVGAWTSPQSQVIPGREWLDEQYEQQLEAFEGQPLQRPPFWGGYIVQPVFVEFWQGRRSRLHDRIQYTLEGDGSWKIERLAP